MAFVLNGDNLTVADLEALARGRDSVVAASTEGLERMAASNRVVERSLARGEAVYGLTTGLGAKVEERLSPRALEDFSYRVLRGRAHAIGLPLAQDQVRAAMIVRLNTLLTGVSGASALLAGHLANVVNAGLVPVVGETASIGAGDLCWGATLGLSLIGEGKMSSADGAAGPSLSMMRDSGIDPFKPGPRDGLALANHSSFTSALMALALADSQQLLESVQAAGALSLESFRANLGVLQPAILSMRPQPGQQRAATGLLELLAGSDLESTENARRLQDPLSIRNIAQVHGAGYAVQEFARNVVESEINAASDNPVVDIENESIKSSGGYYTPLLTIAAETLSRTWVQIAVMQLSRMSKMLSDRFTGLPAFLATPSPDSNGFAPMLKTAEALLAELQQFAAPVAVWPSVNADGVEDVQTNSPTAAKALHRVISHGRVLCAMELIIAAQAYEHREPGSGAAPGVEKVHQAVRSAVKPLQEDRPMAGDLEAIAEKVARGEFDFSSWQAEG